jgi:aryl-alcohol dehydrogenase
VSIETLQLEEPRSDEVLVRVVAAGVCHTDILIRDGVLPTPPPVVLGHEGAGVVERVGRCVTKVGAGDHVVMSFNSCGHCESCIEGATTYCHEIVPYNFAGQRPDGSSALSKEGERINGHFFAQSSWATHAICNERNIVKVPKSAPLELLGPLGCGIQTGAGAVINALKVGAGKSIAVFGVGTVGLSGIMAARVVGATKIIAIDVHDTRLELARQLGATHTINSRRDDPTKAILELTGSGTHFAFDTTGIAGVIRSAVDALAPRGVCGIVGASAPGSEIILDEAHFMTGGRRLIGIVQGEAAPDVFIPMLVDLHQQGRFPFDQMVRFYSLQQINEAIHDSESGATIKPIVVME